MNKQDLYNAILIAAIQSIATKDSQETLCQDHWRFISLNAHGIAITVMLDYPKDLFPTS